MPRVEELIGFVPAVRDCEIGVLEGEEIKSVPGKQLAFGDQFGNQIRIGMTLEGRDELVKLLTGGVHIATMVPPVLQ
jgi:hypothetical protein